MNRKDEYERRNVVFYVIVGFEKVTSGCCGTGYLEASFLCNYKTWVCDDVSKYVFFDSIHPTERTYYNVFMSLRPIIDYLFKD